jgi:cytochrome P450
VQAPAQPEPAAAPKLKFNPYDPAFRANPHLVYDRLRSEAPFFRTLGTVVLTRYDDVAEVLKSRAFSAALIPQTIAAHARKLKIEGIEQVERFINNSIVFTDNPAHARLRRLVNQAYSAAAVQGLREAVARTVEEMFDAVAGAGEMDVVRDLAEPLPVRVLCDWMGVPAADREFIRAHVHSIRFLLDPGLMTRGEFRAVLAAMAELVAYFEARIAGGAADAGEGNLIARLANARTDDGDRLGEEEVAFAAIMSFVAGTETTQCLIGNLVNTLLANPTQLELIRADRTLIPAAVSETIRLETPLQLTKRLALSDFPLGDDAIRAGEQVLLCLAAANRDPAQYPEPARYDLAREGRPHVGFGYGMHNCLGGALAQMQVEIVLDAFVRRFAALERADEREVWQKHSLILRGLDTLPLRFTAA